MIFKRNGPIQTNTKLLFIPDSGMFYLLNFLLRI